MSWHFESPVSVFFYRRPDHLRQVMTKIREARPAVLFGVSDGPKPRNEEIQKGVEESRRIFREMIDWPCRWELLERETNLGSYLSVSRGLDWVFERVAETIILEDDTVPDLTFFRFAGELLEKYRDDPKVGAVCGNNYDDPKSWTSEASYRFTRYHHSWGWATWKRAWQYFDREEKLLAEIPRIKKENWMRLSRKEWTYWGRCFQRTYARKLDAWDYRWTLSLWINHMACVIPKVNLVRNIGFDEKATHTVERNFMDLKMHSIKPMRFPLVIPSEKECRLSMDNLVFKQHYQKLEGRRSFLRKIRDRLKKYFKTTTKSSISDTDNYRLACLEAAHNEESFSIFKQDSRYKEILEHTDYKTGLLYLEEIKENTKLLESIRSFSVNDKLGNPEVFMFPGIGLFSPSTLRYVKVYADLVKRFRNLSHLKITEIGGGYGGQCLIIHQHANPKSYRIFDLPEPLLLTQRYLMKSKAEKTDLCTLEKPIVLSQSSALESDLLISNYAFSEIDSQIQKIYLEKVIINSKKGYMTMNSISEACGVDSMPFNRVIKTLEARGPVKVETEKPLTFPGNQIIWWDWS